MVDFISTTPAIDDVHTPPKDTEIEDEQQVCLPEHCFHAFDTLYCALTHRDPVPPTFPDEKFPLFVTWSTRQRNGRAPRLRGCIGTFEPMPIHEGIAEYALISAFRDTRFSPIEERELETLECGISLLTNFEDGASYLDWTVGVHGIRISFAHPPATSPSASSAPSPLSSGGSAPARRSLGRTYSATYLPEIAPEQGWDRLEAVDSAIRKSGYSGRITEDLRRSIRLRRYQSSKCAVSWDEYAQWRVAQGGEM